MSLPRRWFRALEVLVAPFALFGAAHAAPVAEPIGQAIVRYWPDAAARAQAPPSLSMVKDWPVRPELPAETKAQPVFSSRGGGRVVHVAIERGTTLYGT